MDSAGFDSARWDHWLLIVCFVAIAATGLWSSWQWRQRACQAKAKSRAKARLARRLAIEVHPGYASLVRSGAMGKAGRLTNAKQRLRTHRSQ